MTLVRKSFSFLLMAGLLLGLAPAVSAAELSAEQEVTVEPTSEVAVTGQLIELSSTDLPTTIIVRENPTGEFTDHTILVDEDTVFRGAEMEDWITGDHLSILGVRNDNTLEVTATMIKQLSIDDRKHRGLNGWIQEIDEAAQTATVRWQDVDHVVNITDDSRLVVPPNVNASLSDFEVGDRVRLRLDKESDGENDVKIMVALRRGNEIFLKARTRGFAAELVEMDIDAEEMTVRLGENAHLRAKDVNNLVGLEDELLTVTWDENTRFVRRYFGKTGPEEMVPGDNLKIIGRVGDDGLVHARLVKDNSIFRRNVSRHHGRISSVDTDANVIKVKLRRGDQLWEVHYNDETTIMKNGKDATEDELQRGDVIRVAGTANVNQKTVAATKIAVRGKLHKAIKRIRNLDDIVKHRIRSSLGKVRPEEVVENQADVDASESLSEEELLEIEEEVIEDIGEEPEEDDSDVDASSEETDEEETLE